MAKTLNAKRAEQSALHKVQTMTLTITVEASEANMQRLAALMLLQDPTRPIPEIADLGPLPFDGEPTDPKPLELDYNAVRNDIMKWFPKYDAKHGRPALKALLEQHGGQTLKTVPEEHLLSLLCDLEAGCE